MSKKPKKPPLIEKLDLSKIDSSYRNQKFIVNLKKKYFISSEKDMTEPNIRTFNRTKFILPVDFDISTNWGSYKGLCIFSLEKTKRKGVFNVIPWKPNRFFWRGKVLRRWGWSVLLPVIGWLWIYSRYKKHRILMMKYLFSDVYNQLSLHLTKNKIKISTLKNTATGLESISSQPIMELKHIVSSLAKENEVKYLKNFKESIDQKIGDEKEIIIASQLTKQVGGFGKIKEILDEFNENARNKYRRFISLERDYKSETDLISCIAELLEEFKSFKNIKTQLNHPMLNFKTSSGTKYEYEYLLKIAEFYESISEPNAKDGLEFARKRLQNSLTEEDKKILDRYMKSKKYLSIEDMHVSLLRDEDKKHEMFGSENLSATVKGINFGKYIYAISEEICGFNTDIKITREEPTSSDERDGRVDVFIEYRDPTISPIFLSIVIEAKFTEKVDEDIEKILETPKTRKQINDYIVTKNPTICLIITNHPINKHGFKRIFHDLRNNIFIVNIDLFPIMLHSYLLVFQLFSLRQKHIYEIFETKKIKGLGSVNFFPNETIDDFKKFIEHSELKDKFIEERVIPDLKKLTDIFTSRRFQNSYAEHNEWTRTHIDKLKLEIYKRQTLRNPYQLEGSIEVETSISTNQTNKKPKPIQKK